MGPVENRVEAPHGRTQEEAMNLREPCCPHCRALTSGNCGQHDRIIARPHNDAQGENLRKRYYTQDDLDAAVQAERARPKAAILKLGCIEGGIPLHWSFDCADGVPALEILEDGVFLYGGWSVRELQLISALREQP
jgi:hypothetical protein